tara:strand:+ start:660 stop:806 length:147 start_codon:yes stop_codon:yes gene_type:complete
MFLQNQTAPYVRRLFDGQAADNFTALRLYILAFPILPLRLGRMPTTSG